MHTVTKDSPGPTDFNSSAIQVLDKAFTLLLNDSVEDKLFTHTFAKFDEQSVTDAFKLLHDHQLINLKDGKWSINEILPRRKGIKFQLNTGTTTVPLLINCDHEQTVEQVKRSLSKLLNA